MLAFTWSLVTQNWRVSWLISVCSGVMRDWSSASSASAFSRAARALSAVLETTSSNLSRWMMAWCSRRSFFSGAWLHLESNFVPCLINPFKEGSEEPEKKDVSRVEMQVGNCSKQIKDRGQKIAFVMVIGHVDKRELLKEAKRIYGSNAALAYRRALWVRRHLLDGRPPEEAKKLESRIIALSAGQEHVGQNPVSSDLALDRGVDVIAYWLDLAAATTNEKQPSPSGEKGR